MAKVIHLPTRVPVNQNYDSTVLQQPKKSLLDSFSLNQRNPLPWWNVPLPMNVLSAKVSSLTNRLANLPWQLPIYLPIVFTSFMANASSNRHQRPMRVPPVGPRFKRVDVPSVTSPFPCGSARNKQRILRDFGLIEWKHVCNDWVRMLWINLPKTTQRRYLDNPCRRRQSEINWLWMRVCRRHKRDISTRILLD